MEYWDRYQTIFWLILFFGGAWLATDGRPKIEAAMRNAVGRHLKAAGVSDAQQPGYVRIRFPVYAGAFVVVMEHAPDVWVPAQNARQLVNALAVTSLKYGLLTLFAPYVLLMLGINYVTHFRSMSG